MNAETTHKPMRRKVRLSAADTAELREILALPHIAAMTPAQRVEHAQSKLADATANYIGWATNPSNERAFVTARRTVETLENAVVLLQIAAGGDVEGLEPIPVEIPAVTPAPELKSELRRAREACFAAAHDAGLSTDSDSMKAAYLDYFHEFGGNSRSLWSVGMWCKMTNAIKGGVFLSDKGRWKRAHYRRAA